MECDYFLNTDFSGEAVDNVGKTFKFTFNWICEPRDDIKPKHSGDEKDDALEGILTRRRALHKCKTLYKHGRWITNFKYKQDILGVLNEYPQGFSGLIYLKKEVYTENRNDGISYRDLVRFRVS